MEPPRCGPCSRLGDNSLIGPLLLGALHVSDVHGYALDLGRSPLRGRLHAYAGAEPQFPTVGCEEAMDTFPVRPFDDGLAKRRQDARSILRMDAACPEVGRDKLDGRIAEEHLRAMTGE